jgi:peptide/nickel transport system substrate-binding protein
VPDDTMRGLELRKGTVDLIVNDVSPDIVWQLRQEGKLGVDTAPGTDYAYIGLNLRDPLLQHLEVRQAIGFAIDREAIVKYLRRGFASTAVGIVPPMSWAFEREVFDFRHDPSEAKRLLDAAGFPDPDGDGPLSRFHLTLKTSTSEVYRIQAAAVQQDLARVGIALDIRSQEFQTLLSDVVRGNFQLYTAQFVGVTDPDMLRRVFHSGQVPPAGLNRVHYQNAAVDQLIERASSAVSDDQRGMFYRQAQQAIARDVPYISLWYKTNIAVFQPDIRGVRLSPIADFTFLRDVYRQAPSSATH